MTEITKNSTMEEKVANIFFDGDKEKVKIYILKKRKISKQLLREVQKI